MEENFVDFKCPYCGEMASFPENVIGRVQKCPNCPESMLVPAEGEFGGKLPLSVSTERLHLRRFIPADWKPLLEVMSNAEVLKYVEWNPLEEAEIEQWIERDRDTHLMQEHDYFLAIELTGQPGGVIGLAGIHFRDDNRQADLTVLINPKYQRKGLGLEAASGLLDFLFSGLNLHRVTVACDARNTAGRHLLQKAGLRLEGEFLKDHMVKGEWVDHASYAVLSDEYAKWAETRKKAELNF